MKALAISPHEDEKYGHASYEPRRVQDYKMPTELYAGDTIEYEHVHRDES